MMCHILSASYSRIYYFIAEMALVSISSTYTLLSSCCSETNWSLYPSQPKVPPVSLVQCSRSFNFRQVSKQGGLAWSEDASFNCLISQFGYKSEKEAILSTYISIHLCMPYFGLSKNWVASNPMVWKIGACFRFPNVSMIPKRSMKIMFAILRWRVQYSSCIFC